MTVIGRSGSAIPGLTAAIAGSFQRRTRPRKMSASRPPVKRRSPGPIPDTWDTGTMPPIAIGNWARSRFARSSGASGASDTAKSTCPLATSAIPRVEPIGS